ncbi:hypothetical protein K501DRAFT_280477 [Backusella circina FSU 941]|nr:hypothetical protein K501DRAFT_280477 [Backusella circina FSU 941]
MAYLMTSTYVNVPSSLTHSPELPFWKGGAVYTNKVGDSRYSIKRIKQQLQKTKSFSTLPPKSIKEKMKLSLIALATSAYIASASAWTFKFCTGEKLTGSCLNAHSNVDATGCWTMNSPLAGDVHSFSYVGSQTISLYNGGTRVGYSVGSWSVGATSSTGSKMNKYCIS